MNAITRFAVGIILGTMLAIVNVSYVKSVEAAEEPQQQYIQGGADYFMYMLTGSGKKYVPEMYKVVREYRFTQPETKATNKTSKKTK